MEKQEILEQIGMKEEIIKKFIVQNNMNIKFEELDEIGVLRIITFILDDRREKLLNLKEDIFKQKEEINSLKEKKLKEIEKEIEEYKKTLEEKINQELQILKVQEESNLKEELEQEKLSAKIKFIKQKEEILAPLKEELKKEIENLIEKQNKLEQKEKELLQQEEILNQQLKTFEVQKEQELNSLKEKIKLKEEEFLHSLKEKEVKKLEEINKKIDKLYKQKEENLQKLQEELNLKEIDITAKQQELNIKEKELLTKESQIENKVNEIIKETIKEKELRIIKLQEEVESLIEEREELIDELNDYQRNENIDVIKELERKKMQLRDLKQELEILINEKNDDITKKEELIRDLKNKNNELLHENEELRLKVIEVERIENENRRLQEKIKEIEILKGENEDLRQKLLSIYSTSEELIKRIENIKEYKQIELKEENPIKDEIKWLNDINDKMQQYGVKYPKRLLYAFHTALKSADFSPISVLSGVSGTGKSELPKLYAYFGGFNFLAEAVQPNWDSTESMLGYYNTLENKFDATDILRFLKQTSMDRQQNKYGYKESMNMILLDEMNLAHIELYFAEFLSKFEQRRGDKKVYIDVKLGADMPYKIPLDRNLLWIGTMNEDETTKSLSDKVLDRSFVINFPRPDELLSRTKLVILEDISEFRYLSRKTWDSWIQKESIFSNETKEIIEKYKDIANQINNILSPTGRAIGHRVWQSMEFYINNHPEVIANKNNYDELEEVTKLAFEEQLVQKIMPKLRGIEVYGQEKEVLDNIYKLLHNEDFKITEDFEHAMKNPYGQFIWNSANYLKE